MTFWNWLALFAFLFATVSVLNAFLSLRVRYFDWRATKNKRKFAIRLKLFEEQLSRVDRYRHNDRIFYRFLLLSGAYVAVLILGAIFFLIVALVLSVAPSKNVYLQAAFLIVALLSVSFALDKTARLYRWISAVNEPRTFVSRIVSFIQNGRTNNLISDEIRPIDKLAEKLIKSALEGDDTHVFEVQSPRL